jgi:DNA invertase Pin-like site-specific DNA recombinase
MVWKLDRLGRSLRDLITMLDDFRDRGTGRAMWQMIGVPAELEPSQRTSHGRGGEDARREIWSQTKTHAAEINQAAKLIAAGERAEDVAASFSVGRTTLYRPLAS